MREFKTGQLITYVGTKLPHIQGWRGQITKIEGEKITVDFGHTDFPSVVITEKGAVTL